MRVVIAIAAALLLGLSACGGSDDDGGEAAQTGTPTETIEETTTEETTTAETTTEAEEEGPVKIRLAYRGGKLSGDTGTVRVPRGAEVELTVRADIEDEVHLHGYDLAADVAPGRPAQINFDADERGRFIVELEHLHLHIVTLRVRG
jgi:hypothetical protein